MLVSNFADSFYVSRFDVGTFAIFPQTGFDFFNQLGFIISSIPVLLLYIGIMIIWRGRRLGLWISGALLVLLLPAVISGLYYLLTNLPKLFTQDLLYLTKNPTSTTWYLDDARHMYTTSLFALRIIIIKSFVKAVLEIITAVFLLIIVTDYESYFKTK